MDKLWAPWRAQYILGEARESGCLFCNRYEQGVDRGQLVLYRDASALVMLNKFPYNNGHVLVAPRAHHGAIETLSAAEWGTFSQLLRRAIAIVQEAFMPDGANLGFNLGTAAGAGIAAHLHAHIVPRWNGDTNFMPVVGQTKVISQSLEACYDLLRPHFAELEAAPP